MEKKRIIHILHSGNFSGAENVAINIGLMFREKYDITFAILEKGNFKEKLEELGLNYILLKNFTFKELGEKVRKFNPDLIHAHDFRASIFSAILFPHNYIISHLHNNPPWIRRPNIYSLAYLSISFRFIKIIGVSAAIKDEFFANSILARKFICLPNIVNKNSISKKAQEPCSIRDIDILFIGRLTLQKDPLKFIEIVKEIKNFFPNIKAVMVGDGELKKECQRKIDEDNLSSNIFLLGYMDNPYPYLRESKMVIMPSQWEGFGLVAVEAMVLGKPVLASPAGGLKGIIKHGITGYFCESIEDFVNRVNSLLNNSEILIELSTNSVKESENYTNVNTYKEKLNTIYENIIGR